MQQSIPQVIRALLVDDHASFRQGVAGVLSSDAGLKLDHCGSIREALEILAQNTYDIVLLDHDLGAERASQFLPAARQIGFEGRVLLVTAWVSDMEARRLLRQGVTGIFLKQGQISELAEGIRTVVKGHTWLDPSFNSLSDEATSVPQAARMRISFCERRNDATSANVYLPRLRSGSAIRNVTIGQPTSQPTE